MGKESVDFIGSMNEDEQRELIALYLNDGVDFPIAKMTRRSRRGGGGIGGPWTAAFLLGMPNAAGRLEAGTSIFGFYRADGRL